MAANATRGPGQNSMSPVVQATHSDLRLFSTVTRGPGHTQRPTEHTNTYNRHHKSPMGGAQGPFPAWLATAAQQPAQGLVRQFSECGCPMWSQETQASNIHLLAHHCRILQRSLCFGNLRKGGGPSKPAVCGKLWRLPQRQHGYSASNSRT